MGIELASSSERSPASLSDMFGAECGLFWFWFPILEDSYASLDAGSQYLVAITLHPTVLHGSRTLRVSR